MSIQPTFQPSAQQIIGQSIPAGFGCLRNEPRRTGPLIDAVDQQSKSAASIHEAISMLEELLQPVLASRMPVHTEAVGAISSGSVSTDAVCDLHSSLLVNAREFDSIFQRLTELRGRVRI